jgi:heme A synthase
LKALQFFVSHYVAQAGGGCDIGRPIETLPESAVGPLATIDQAAPRAAAAHQKLRRFASFATFAAIWTYALIVFGGIVRITGSGMGCGDDWPKCNGRWIPPMTLETLIEYTHRLLGVSIGLVLIGVFAYAFRHRRSAGFAGKNGVLRYALWVLVLVVVQGLLGAVTVWLEIPPTVVVVHFATALIIMAILLAAAVRARALAKPEPSVNADAAHADARHATIALLLGFVVVVFGALVANHPGAPQACQGFPLCNGSVLPGGAWLVQMHWLHRFIAFAAFFYVAHYGFRASRRVATPAVRNSAVAAAVAITLQVAVAAGLVLMHLPRALQALHLAVGAAVWAFLVLWYATAQSLTAQKSAA